MKKDFLSSRVEGLQESATLALNAKVKQLKAAGQPVYNFTAGELDGSTPIFIQKTLAGKLDQNKYTPTAGLLELRQKIADYENRRLKTDFTTDSIVATTGVKTAIYGLLQVLLNPGDEVIVPTPAWVSYAAMIELAGGKLVEAPLTTGSDLDVAAIDSALTTRTKAVLINSPHNPTGAVFSKQALGKLAKLLGGKPILVISDEIYETLIYEQPFYSIANLGFPAEQLIVVNGFSKSQALTGWRIGYAAAPKFVASTLTNFLSHASGNAPLPAQLAAIEALKRGNRPSMLSELQKRRQTVQEQLKKISKIKFNSPGGAFYFWLDLRGLTNDSFEWCQRLLDKTGVALVPGEAFLAPGFARLSFATDEQTIDGGLKKLKQFIEDNA